MLGNDCYAGYLASVGKAGWGEEGGGGDEARAGKGCGTSLYRPYGYLLPGGYALGPFLSESLKLSKRPLLTTLFEF